jgi:hypothetical protein
MEDRLESEAAIQLGERMSNNDLVKHDLVWHNWRRPTLAFATL